MEITSKMDAKEAKEEEIKKKKSQEWLNALYLVLGLGMVVLIWDIIYWSAGEKVFPEFFKTLSLSLSYLADKQVMVGLGYSILRITISLAIVLLLGVFLGLLAAFYPPLEKIMSPFIYLLTCFPTASMIFVLIIYTRITEYLLVSFLTFPIIYKAALGGGKSAIQRYLDPIKMEGRYSSFNFFHVVLPLSMPYIFVGFSQASGLALKAEIMGEVFMSDNRFRGIGFLINAAYTEVDINRLFALTLLAIMTMSLVDLAAYFIKRELNNRYGVEPIKTFRLF
jgi:NitT/TauT family transport system permease protein